MGWAGAVLLLLAVAAGLFAKGWRVGQRAEAYDAVLWLLAGAVALGLAALVGLGGLMIGGTQ